MNDQQFREQIAAALARGIEKRLGGMEFFIPSPSGTRSFAQRKHQSLSAKLADKFQASCRFRLGCYSCRKARLPQVRVVACLSRGSRT